MPKSNKYKDNIIEDMQICDGIEISNSIFAEKEKRTKTLFLKGIIVFLLCFGSIGGYLSAFDIEYNAVVVFFVLFPVAIVCALLYYRLSTENIGYILVFGIFIVLVLMFKDYINSGFYAIVNMTIKEASFYFDLEGMQEYGERIENRYVTVTFAFVFIGIVVEILLNVYISRRMQHLIIIPITMGLFAVPLYVEREPDFIHIIMLLSGIAMSYVIKQGKHYGIKRSNNKFSRDKHQNIIYNYNIKALRNVSLWVVIFIVLVVGGVNFVKPSKEFQIGYVMSNKKEDTMEFVSAFVVSGISGLINYNESTGGINGGELGNTSSIIPDYETDLIVTFAPYSSDTVYLRSFVGVSYVPFDNYWETYEDGYQYDLADEYNAISKAYTDGDDKAGKGTMTIENIDATAKYPYYPYYSSEKPIGLYMGEYVDVNYFTNLSGEIKIETDMNLDVYTEVPSELKDTLSDFCKDNNISGTNEEIINKVSNYFNDNISYTMKPGRTPNGKDYIKYFLKKNKKGYCSHFASSATMIYRYMGIPARYVEGYAISYDQILSGELADGYDYKDYYSGYSSLGKTAVVTVEVPDAWAHAWVEVYIEGSGWTVVDPTPSTNTEETDEDFWDVFSEWVSPKEEGTGGNSFSNNEIMNFKFSQGQLKLIWGIIFLLSALVVSFVGGKRIIDYMSKIIKYIASNNSDKIIIKYSNYYNRKVKKYKELGKLKNYEEQVTYLSKESGNTTNEIIQLLNKAGFSGKEITRQEFIIVNKWLRSKKQGISCQK